MGFLSAALPVVGSIASSLIGSRGAQDATEEANEAQIASAREQMAFQEKSTQKQMDFQERMSNTAHQRQIEDLRKAGLNPILSAKYGGASTPSGASGSGAQANIQSAAPHISAAYANIAKAFTSIPDMVKASASAKQIGQQSKLLKEQTLTEKQRTKQIEQNTAESLSRTNLNNEQKAKVIKEVTHLDDQIKLTKARTTAQLQFNDIKEPLSQFLRNINAPEIGAKSGSATRDIIDTVRETVTDALWATGMNGAAIKGITKQAVDYLKNGMKSKPKYRTRKRK